MTEASVRTAEETRDLPIPPLAVGLIAFGILTFLMILTLGFGKGRPHC
ncbi:MAG TPA: hypothetical protein VFR22_02375 [Nocardioidaceae bacterium]|nr:hypothetical protein [Nocardioidaceae bacterium]